MPSERAAASRARLNLAEISDTDSEPTNTPVSSFGTSAPKAQRKTKPASSAGRKRSATTPAVQDDARSLGRKDERVISKKPMSIKTNATVPTEREVVQLFDSEGNSDLSDLSTDEDLAMQEHVSPSAKPSPSNSSKTRTPSPVFLPAPRIGLGRSGSSIIAGLLGSSQPSPPKRSLLLDDSSEEDDLPSTITKSTQKPETRTTQRPPRKKRARSPSSVVKDSGPDPSLTIPGEVVLALWKDRYWPATLQAYTSSPNGKSEGKYRVVFFDRMQEDLRRSQFKVYPDDEDFATCELGNIESRAYNDTESTMTCIPDSNPPIPPPDNLSILPMHTQVAYIKPVILAILNNQYAPCSSHQRFFQGWKGRQGVMQKQHLTGSLGDDVSEALGGFLRKWLLGPDHEKVRELEGLEDTEMLDCNELTEASATSQEGNDVKQPHSLSNVDTPTQVMPSEELAQEFGPVKLNVIADNLIGIPNSDAIDVDVPLPPASSQPISDVPSSDGLNVSQQNNPAPSHLTHLEGVSWVPLVNMSTSALYEEAGASSTAQPTLGRPPLLEDNSELPPRGCDAYECLDMIGKLHYCENVIRPEAVQQLLLWHKGERTCVSVQDDAEEERLHTRGVELSMQTDIVTEVLGWRRQERRRRKLPPDGPKTGSQPGVGKFSSSGRAIRERALKK